MSDVNQKLSRIENALKRLGSRMSMISLQPGDLRHAQDVLGQLQAPVKFVYFSENHTCRHCWQEEELLAELSVLDPKLSLEAHSFAKESGLAARYDVQKTPCTILVGERDYGVRYYGMPSGFEFLTFMQAIRLVSQGESGLTPALKGKVAHLDRPAHIEVFTAAQFPFSGVAMLTAHQLAIESDRIRGDVIDVADFPELVERYQIMAAPTVVVNGEHQLCGVGSAEAFVDRILQVLGKP